MQRLTINTIPLSDRDEYPHAAQSAYVEQFWLPLLGPTATFLLRLAVELENTTLPADHVTRQLGVQERALRRACMRLDTFRAATFYDGEEASLVVYSHLPWITGRAELRLPEPMRRVHRRLRAA